MEEACFGKDYRDDRDLAVDTGPLCTKELWHQLGHNMGGRGVGGGGVQLEASSMTPCYLTSSVMRVVFFTIRHWVRTPQRQVCSACWRCFLHVIVHVNTSLRVHVRCVNRLLTCVFSTTGQSMNNALTKGQMAVDLIFNKTLSLLWV